MNAIYSCVTGSGGGYKVIFGKGTELRVNSGEKIEPAHYTVRNENVEACLTTNLAAPNSTDDYLKDAVRFSGESFYSSLSLNKMCDETAKSCNSGEEFYQSEKTNFLTLSIYWLRVLFVKTIVFNVLMTLKVWIS
ncbi:M1-specific T cell receptor alpha chain-like [Brachyhypopomus gauderio]|uniref:M1-specific T cell receptor alpha chain-like n=1 Tax=Brachyhypopomus gauderio TaxID=698409 RepID=UPI0040437600